MSGTSYPRRPAQPDNAHRVTNNAENRCTALFILRSANRRPGTYSQCVMAQGHRGPHKSRKPGGMVNWKERQQK